MKKYFLTFFLIYTFYSTAFSTPDFYLITIGESKEPYAMYGHTAIRITDSVSNMDFIVDWGVFNFDQPDFYFNFARGNMIYTTGTQNFNNFLYHNQVSGKGSIMQKILLNDEQKERFWGLISWMLEPENKDYRYRFLYDNCATRPRDLLEATLQDDLIYPIEESLHVTFRDMLHQYQQVNLWYNLLIDIILGSNIDKDADLRAQMFLPEYLKYYMSRAYVRDHNNDIHPLLDNPVVLVEKTTLHKTTHILFPEIIFLLLLFLIIILDYLKKGKWFLRIFDIVLFGSLIFFGLIIIFMWGMTEHQEAYNNFNLIWANPLYIFTLIALKTRNKQICLIITVCCLMLFFILEAFNVFPQKFPFSMFILIFIVVERCIASIIRNIKE